MSGLSLSLAVDRLTVVINCLISFIWRKPETFIYFFPQLDLRHFKNYLARAFYSAWALPSHIYKNSSPINQNDEKYRIILLRNKIKNA